MVTLNPKYLPGKVQLDTGNQQDPNKPRRNRNVATPGSRGGHYRKVWSNKLHKFYIKYGKPEGGIKVENEEEPSKSKPEKEGGTAAQNISRSLPLRADQKPLEEMLGGLYQELLKNFRIGKEGSGQRHHGRMIDFGRISPATGEIVTKENGWKVFYLYDEKGKILKHVRRKIPDNKKAKEFFCYMTARYAMEKFMDGKVSQQKSLFMLNTTGSEVLRKTFIEIELGKIAPAIAKQEFPAIETQFSALKRSLNKLESLQEPKKRTEQDKLQKSLGNVNRYLSRIEKAGPRQMWNAIAPASAGRRFGSAGSGSVFRNPGRPPGSGQQLTAASAALPGNSGLIAPGQDRPIPESDKDWKGHRQLKVGAHVKVQHPHAHERPIWGRVVGIGDDGVQVQEDDGTRTNIRWHHIHDLKPLAENTPQNAFEIAKQRIPMEGTSGIDKDDHDAAEKYLRKLKIPYDSDVIHSGHNDKNKAYSQLLSDKAPIDMMEATRKEGDGPSKNKLTQSLVAHAMNIGLPVDPELLKELPFDTVISILHHHMNKKKENDGE